MDAERVDPDLLKILISTDNHLGVWEKDEVRRDDSFDAFEEVLITATSLGADAVLLGGDLFHENKPSRASLVKAMQIISQHCLGDRPVPVQILSDQSSNFVSGQANYLDPNLNVGMPIFTIHGNHDDPSGSDNLSAVDILSSCKLVNYFGKHLLTGSSIGRVTISPILLKKGNTRLALYGLGSVRDERLGRLFAQAGMVTWQRPQPTEEVGLDDWVNVMVLHQNRVERGAQAKNTVQEAHLPAFLDLVVWGHEHECRPSLEDLRNPDVMNSGKSSKVLQPGSSVVTSLSEGEAKRKHLFMLEVKNNAYRVINYPLTTVRPFIFETVALKDQRGVRVEEPDTVTAFLEAKVSAMIERASLDNPSEPGVAPKLPLVRLRVDYTGFSTINAQRFGHKFVNKVANPQDILIWHKAAARRVKSEGAQLYESEELLRPEALDQQRIEDLVASNLKASLRVLHEDDLATALHNFVEKDEKQALHDLLSRSLYETTMPMLKDTQKLGVLGNNDVDLEEAVVECVRQRRDAKASGTQVPLENVPLLSSAFDFSSGDLLSGPPGTVHRGAGGAPSSLHADPPSTVQYNHRGMSDVDTALHEGGGGEMEETMGGGRGAGPSKRGGRATQAASSRGRGARGGGKGQLTAGAGIASSGKKQPSLFDSFMRTASQATATATQATTSSAAVAAPTAGKGFGDGIFAVPVGIPSWATSGPSEQNLDTQGSVREAAKSRSTTLTRQKRPQVVGADEIEDHVDELIEVTTRNGRRTRPTSRAASAKKGLKLASDDEAGLSDENDCYRDGEELEDNVEDESLEEEYIEDSDDGTSRKRKAGRALQTPKRGGTSGRGQKARAKAPTGRGRQDEDEICLDYDDPVSLKENSRQAGSKADTLPTATTQSSPGVAGTQATSTQGGGRKKPASFMQAVHPPKPKGKNWGAAK
ncbi:hypothetical protein CEUSTIGMA_g13208.t1 [Chlamydomonas eustigma]|uniref:Mre11 DNA-binding domain-containing protein n=1 Tax=Chlamydomonas eustigma TaxID=1157962 RepID=A0A250XRZ9_9CHLO|nr:hypothetical protein CEUSTIGMA_g13208.t1 [Chlamydomonas eustigma]|eukprot:GAX85793.1 hypothetical protein CEUSTIGMA_g13208.t1 [Chlamydomonas eustigma]